LGSTTGDDTREGANAHGGGTAEERAESAVQRIVRLATKLLSVRMAAVSVVTTGRARIEASVGVDAAALGRDLPLHDETISRGRVESVLDATRDQRYHGHPLVAGQPHLRFFAAEPLRAADGRILGALFVMDPDPRETFSDDDGDTLRDLAAMIAAHVDARQTLGHIAPITGLANRIRLLDDVESFIENDGDDRSPLTIAIVETATPHEYSEMIRVFGAGCADAFERESARIIRQVVPAYVRLYHLSVGRFACVFTEATDGALLDDIFARLHAAVAAPTTCDGVPIAGDAAFGVASYPADADRGEELFRAAVTAVHDARQRGVRWSRYDAAQDRAYRRAFAILTDLPRALASSEQPLEIHYQPQIDLASGACTGAEALVRWTHRELGAIPPIEFVTLAERTELIHPLTEWVIGTTFSQLATWRRAGMNLRVSINISMRDLERADFPCVVRDLMASHRVRSDWFELEVTESVLMENHKVARAQLEALEALGVEIAIDDFGTGQSALAYLKHLPARVLKIDQIFVRGLAADLNDQHIVRSTIDLAHDLGCKVVAEGIETIETCYWLADRGCDFGQGYAISRPLPATQFISWMDDRSRRVAMTTPEERRREAWPLDDVVPERSSRIVGRQNTMSAREASP
jgi:EAL domain-containing protein (putative c-di-GMP-specific phosphodiesterase class I)/GGDEF domain-containing protein